MSQSAYYWRNAKSLSTLFVRDHATYALIKQVRAERLTYLEPAALADLHGRVAAVEKQALPGLLIEAGCALGGSALLIAAAKQPQRPLYLYDTFAMIPPPTDADGQDAHQRYETISAGAAAGIKGEAYYGYQENLRDKVAATFQAYGYPPESQAIHLVQGLYEDTLRVEQPVALAHIDCDWHDSVLTCLAQIEPHLVPGGVLVIDDYNDWSGCRTAVDSYFANRMDQYDFQMKSRLHIVRRQL